MFHNMHVLVFKSTAPFDEVADFETDVPALLYIVPHIKGIKKTTYGGRPSLQVRLKSVVLCLMFASKGMRNVWLRMYFRKGTV